MEYSKFLELDALKTIDASESTLKFWYRIYAWVVAHEYADTADSPEFVDHIREVRDVSTATISRHLRRMSDCGLLDRHEMRRRLSKDDKETFLNPFITMFMLGNTTIPSSFARYCLAGKPCSRVFNSPQRASDQIDKRGRELREKMKEQIKPSDSI